MKVGMYYNNTDVRLEHMPVPAIGDHDLLMEVNVSGICGSDIMEWYRIQKAPLVLGHEVTGTVVELGKNIAGFRVGDRIFSTHHVPCDVCHYCLHGHHTACETFHAENNFDPGGFAEYLRITGKSLNKGTLKLPDEVPMNRAHSSNRLVRWSGRRGRQRYNLAIVCLFLEAVWSVCSILN